MLIIIPWLFLQYFSTASDLGAVCVIGDVQGNYDSSCDPRTLMGTYTSISNSGKAFDEQFMDISSYDPRQYLFKIKEPTGWVLSESLPQTDINITSTVSATCFEDSLLDCGYDKWFWGYNRSDHEVTVETMHVLEGQCSGFICLRNLTIQLKSDGSRFAKLDGEYNRSWDHTTDRYQWYDTHTSTLRWYYRENVVPGGSISYNWVLGQNGADRIACSPGY
eukprot:890589_1